MTGHSPRILLAILALNVGLSLAYGFINPLFEAPDEHLHYFTAQWIADSGRLPAVPQPARERFFVPQDEADWLGQEAAQPPLYYLLAALVVAPFDTGDARAETIHNPLVRLGDPAARVNVNAFAHGHERGSWTAAVYLLRTLSAVMGGLTVWLIFLSGRLLWPARPAAPLLAAGVAAFLPQFTFQFSAVSNDTLVTLLATAALYQLLLADEARLRLPAWRWLLLGVTLGLAVLTKNQGLVLLIFAAGFLAARWLRSRWAGSGGAGTRPDLAAVLGLVLLPAVALGLPLWLRNWRLYGDLTAANQFVIIAGGDRGFTLWQSLAEWPAVWYSYFASFGWFNVVPPGWVYVVWTVLVGLALLGGVISLPAAGRTLAPAAVRFLTATPLLLAGWVAAVLAALVAFNMQTPAAQGRLLFPALLPIALFLGHGLDRVQPFLPRPARLWPLAVLAGINLYCLFFVLRPVYALPRPVESLPETALIVETPLAPGLTLVGAELHAGRARPGEEVPLTLYWRRDEGLAGRPELVVELFGRDQSLLGKIQSWHGRGLYPADFWPEGVILAEETTVGIIPEPGGALPALARVNVKLAGRDEVLDIGGVAVEPLAYPPLEEELLARFGEQIELRAIEVDPGTAEPGETIEVRPVWQVRGEVGGSYAVFVQLGRPDAPPLAQGDAVPLGGAFPTTVWRAGQVLADGYRLALPADLPAGDYPLHIGFYRTDSPGERLPLTVAGERQPFDAFQAAVITVGGKE